MSFHARDGCKIQGLQGLFMARGIAGWAKLGNPRPGAGGRVFKAGDSRRGHSRQGKIRGSTSEVTSHVQDSHAGADMTWK